MSNNINSMRSLDELSNLVKSDAQDMSQMNSHVAITKHLKKTPGKLSGMETLTEALEYFKTVSDGCRCVRDGLQHIRVSSGPADYRVADEADRRELEGRLHHVECMVADSIYTQTGIIYNWNEIFRLLHDPIYKGTEKGKRKVVYSTAVPARPVGDAGYNMWNGLQIIDLDIKDAGIAEQLKEALFNILSQKHWFIGICKSASGKGLHVWTKITPVSATTEERRVEYLCNYRMKYSYVYLAMLAHATEIGYTKDDVIKYLDMAMAKPQQGIFISSDDTAKLSVNFYDARLDINFEAAYGEGAESIDWISHKDLKHIFTKLEWFNKDNFDKSRNIKPSNITNTDSRDASKSVRRHYKHAQRWQLANTLTSLYGYDKALQLMTEICSDTDLKELRADVKTASIHNKPVSLWAIKTLNKVHGFNIKMTGDNGSIIPGDTATEEPVSPTGILGSTGDTLMMHLKKNQYLSDIKDDIISNLSTITLLEAGAGYGKTEMIKALGARVLLVLPFTSTIKAKIEKSAVTEDWLYFYGDKQPQLTDILSKKSMSMTVDKFSKLNIHEINAGEFDYIVFDESHLIFTSSYRNVMSPAVQRLANTSTKVILMTGTPTGELLFFPNIRHIRVEKDDTRIKRFTAHMCPTETEQRIEMCRAMAADVMSGKKVLFPTNKGSMYFDQITGLVQQELNAAGFGRRLKAFYYKKSNFGTKDMDDINFNKTVGDNDIITCTSYLSVGVDICDRSVFSVYFDQIWISQDMEQFANRIRNNDLYINLFLKKRDKDGIPVNYEVVHPFDLSINEDDLAMAHDIVKMCNDAVERNLEEYTYNTFIEQMLAANKHIKYDESTGKHYVDETAYKLSLFEDRYSDYATQFRVMAAGMKYYGYEFVIKDYTAEVAPDRRAAAEEYIKNIRNIRFNAVTAATYDLINHITDTNIDLYREVMRGNYDILRAPEYASVRERNNLYTCDLEVIEKNIPIILSLYKFYDIGTIRSIYEYCTNSKMNKINFAALGRVRKFVSIEHARQKKRLDFPVMKFVRDARKVVEASPKMTKTEIAKFLAGWTVKYANSIPHVIVQDTKFLQKLYDYAAELWRVVIVQENTRTGTVIVKPFKLLWEKKTSLKDIYDIPATQEFFMQELIDKVKEEEGNAVGNAVSAGNIEDEENEYIDSKEFEHTVKYNIIDVREELTSLVSKSFDYSDYSSRRDSETVTANARFLENQYKHNRLAGTVFAQVAPMKASQSYIGTKEADLFKKETQDVLNY